jgi:drug/metabolite transporter (DMT)-like permease
LSPAANRQGILAMVLAMSAFIGSDTLMKIATGALPPGEIMAVRGLFASLITLGLVGATRTFRQAKGLWSPLVMVRAALESVIAFLFITALGQLPLANVTAILQATPLILTLLCVAFGLERVGRRRWAEVAAGFLGVLLIVRPSPAGFNAFAGIALLCAAVVAGRDLVTRFIPRDVPSVVIALSTTASVGLAGVLFGAGETWRVPDPAEMGLLGAAALFVAIGNLAIIRSLRVADASVVSPFRYSIILMSLALGTLVFGEWPDLPSVLGIALVIASGVYALWDGEVERAGDVQAKKTALADTPS